ncbi:His-Xaa-Ser system protein HxsD [Pseudoalteromonas shioyasakiensis]|uniref:His-Xaa-Ser system protein HxsD n=1 Tax=Pseudoalteromonas shioyasakiensis TaxID=1190813 RepID=UPI001EFD74FC|nr:His-Xaa-Ser system protein HxsD [Pseudoalteromonas shioyasakiensis]MCG9733397.1 His-Xaa-Ser system protein HxsD [Pseudoalteromonas shioyasakiensis]
MILSLSKKLYSELVFRKALYWLKSEYQWTMEENEGEWLIKLNCSQEDFVNCNYELHKLLNDYSLREKIDSQTDDLKLAIIRKALKDLSKE